MISSAMLPKVALSKPPIDPPRWAARLSVARPMYPASGTIGKNRRQEDRRLLVGREEFKSQRGRESTNQESGRPVSFKPRTQMPSYLQWQCLDLFAGVSQR